MEEERKTKMERGRRIGTLFYMEQSRHRTFNIVYAINGFMSETGYNSQFYS